MGGQQGRPRASGWLTIGLFLALQAVPVTAQPTLAAAVKAAYIYNLMKFVEWPDQALPAEPELRIGVLGHDLVTEALTDIEGRSARGRTVRLRQLERPSDAAACQVLYLGASEKDRCARILSQLGGATVLTVSDLPDFVREGGLVGFFLEEDRVRLEISRSKALKIGLKFSAHLLEVARVVP